MRDQFWKKYPLTEHTQEEWEALCDGCALCCLHKLEDEDTGRIAITDVVCQHLDLDQCRCTDYANRHTIVPDCVPFDQAAAKAFYWLPETCAYRRLANDQALPYWHYLETGDKTLVHSLMVSVQHQSISETLVAEDDWQERVIRWVDTPTG